MKNINEQIEKLQAELDELKAIANAPKDMIERAKEGEIYYLINAHHEVNKDTECNTDYDNQRYETGNYYTDKALAERVAKYYRNNNMFIRKGIEIADGYEFKDGAENWLVCINSGCNEYDISRLFHAEESTSIHMTKQNAEKFKEWLDENMPLGDKS